jgi:C1A family cysteine protease
MKAIIILALVAVATALTDHEAWEHFLATYGNTYANSNEAAMRYQIFVENLRVSEQLQSMNPSATYGITKFMDLTPEEFRTHYANLNATEYKKWINTLPVHHSRAKAANIDWRGKAVASVKDQGQCGSCWAFSAAGALEGCIMLKNGGTKVDVSAQQIVDCCTAGGSDGCNGGYPNLCIQWAVPKDMATWASYPYTASKGTCKAVKTIAVPKNTCKYVSIASTESALQTALANGPVSIALDAGVLQYYTGEIISGNDCSGTAVDHAVLMVAWVGTTYTIKNSWGTSWGEAGFFRCVSGKNCMDLTAMSSMALPK